MAKLYKVELYIIDVNNNYSNLNEIMHDIGNSTDCSLIPFNSQEVEIDWHDGIDIKLSNCPVENFSERASYLTDVPNDCLDAFIHALQTNNPAIVYFDAEGFDYHLISSPSHTSSQSGQIYNNSSFSSV